MPHSPSPPRRFIDRVDPFWALAALWWIAAVLAVNSVPSSLLPTTSRFPLPPHADKIVHFIMYGGMAMVVWNAMIPRRPWRGLRPPVAAALLVPCVIGLADELHQSVVPGRSCDWRDLLVDWVAAGCAVWVATRRRPRRVRRASG